MDNFQKRQAIYGVAVIIASISILIFAVIWVLSGDWKYGFIGLASMIAIILAGAGVTMFIPVEKKEECYASYGMCRCPECKPVNPSKDVS